LSQMPPQSCPRCGVRVEAGQRFCPNCGSAVPQATDPTVAASGVASSPNNTPYGVTPSNPGYNAYPPSASGPSYPGYPGAPSDPGNPGYPGYPSTVPNSSNPAYPGVTPPAPQPGAYTQYNSGAAPQNSGTVPPPAPIDPYNTATKKRSPLTAIIIAVVVIVLIAGGTGIFLFTRNSNNKGGANTGGNNNAANTYASSQPIDLTVTYASDQITFNKIQQATKFSDDSETSYTFNTPKDYVRVSFNEKQTATESSYFGYFDAFRLKLPNGSTVQALNSEETSGPEQGVQRPNWVDFPSAAGEVDLSNLTIILGTSDEAQETFPLKSNADVSKYQPKTFTINTSPFKYAGMDMTIKSATQSYYYNGAQAKTGKVFLAIALQADNNQDSDIYLDSTNFLRLKTSDATVSPDYSSDLNNFDIINAQTTGITGTAIFDVTPSPDGKYTLIFQSGSNITEVDQPIQLS
jgi:zinc-ribbon domain/Domain of unknown function (DUF4352)